MIDEATVKTVNLCPTGCGELTHARAKDVEFSDGEHEVMVTIYYTWCPVCRYEGDIHTFV